jgi:predicted HD phosphohydrolase
MEFDDVSQSDQATTWENLKSEINMDNASIALLHYHYKLNHLSMRKLQSIGKMDYCPQNSRPVQSQHVQAVFLVKPLADHGKTNQRRTPKHQSYE